MRQISLSPRSVCLATSGPGGRHLLNGLYDAKLDGQPVLAITGMPYHDRSDPDQQDVELDKVFADVAEYSIRMMGPTHVENVAPSGLPHRVTSRGVSHITFPVDLQHREIKGERSKRNIPGRTSDVLSHGARLPHEGDLAQAADILNEGKKIVILAGRGALHAGPGLEQLADTLGAPIVKALLGKAAVPDDSPFTTGTVGLLGTRPSQEAMERCDTLLMVGTSFPYIEFLPKPGEARGSKSNWTPRGSVSAIRSKWGLPATASARCGHSSRCSSATTIGASSRPPNKEWRNGGRSWRNVGRAPKSR